MKDSGGRDESLPVDSVFPPSLLSSTPTQLMLQVPHLVTVVGAAAPRTLLPSSEFNVPTPRASLSAIVLNKCDFNSTFI